MKVAAYQAPLESSRCEDARALIREQVVRCETLGVEILCCPEAVLGGLADYAAQPAAIAIDVDGGGLDETAQASDSVTTILGFTEIDRSGRLFNAAAVLSQGVVVGVYRKLHPAINRSVYHAGSGTPVFTVGRLTFGIVICRDSIFPEPAAAMPPAKGGAELVLEARRHDIPHRST